MYRTRYHPVNSFHFNQSAFKVHKYITHNHDRGLLSMCIHLRIELCRYNRIATSDC